jgi:UDP-MurNAc hydroxylase
VEKTKHGIRVTYFYSACVGIASPDVRVLCDPWFTEGIYDGSWFHYPKLENPLEVIGEVDFVYVSHIHPDHYDPCFLRLYLERYPTARVIITSFVPNYLSMKMKADGIAHEVVDERTVGDTHFNLVLSGCGPPSSIDSALVMRCGSRSVVNFNDNPGGVEQMAFIKSLCGEIDIALLPYAGAGAWPQTYFDAGDELRERAEQKQHSAFERYRRIASTLDPKVRIPFAGKYVLGGHLHELNASRGVPDAVEVLDFDSQAVVLADGGQAWIDTETLKPSSARTEAYDGAEVATFIRSLANQAMDYEREFGDFDLGEVPFDEILNSAYRHAHERSICEIDWFFCIELSEGWFVFNANRNQFQPLMLDEVANVSPRSELRIDLRYLFGLLTFVYHWNNAEIGSQYQTRRFPEEYRAEVQGFLNFFHVPRSEQSGYLASRLARANRAD